MTGKKILFAVLCTVTAVTVAVSTILLIRPSQEEKIALLRQKSDTFLVITRDMFVEELKPWLNYREGQGFRVVVGSWPEAPTVDEIKLWITETIKKSDGMCRYIMLVGDWAGQKETDAPWHIPGFVGPPGYQYDEEEPVPSMSDAVYGDIDDDGRIEVAVGRLPVRTGEDLALQIAKIIQFEKRPVCPSFYRAVLWTGGKHHHLAIHHITLQFIDQMLPGWLYSHVISSHPESVCSGPLEDQPGQFLAALSLPAFITMVVGHGDYNNIRCAEADGEEIPLTVEAIESFQSTSAVGPLVLLACKAGSYYMPAEKGPSVAEAFLLHPGGPVAVIAAAGNVNVLTNFYLAGSMVKNINSHSETIGDLLVESRQILHRVGRHTLSRLLEHDPRVRALLGPPGEDNREMFETRNLIRNEGLLYNLLGDPSLAFVRPIPMDITAEETGEGLLTLAGATPESAKELWVHHYDLDRYYGYFAGIPTDEERRRYFMEANRPPDLLFHDVLRGGSWQAQLDLRNCKTGYGSRIRVLAGAEEGAYYQSFAFPFHENIE